MAIAFYLIYDIILISVIAHILHHISRTGKMPVPQRVNFIVDQAGKPVHKRLIENGTISQL
ncbi:hypothetical protein CP500_004835 [Tychonema bourrellyi FEM_GT703]|uniref:Uncharacterized protein n=1 Tax=Tychonema bourrellyi FEM_GT703 TaxID=2040638 RepID=A0A2G4F4A8_9CYAN|nr:hypothetical protein CP500_004835 [Tychonema bourrellyi FEM_GT703]